MESKNIQCQFCKCYYVLIFKRNIGGVGAYCSDCGRIIKLLNKHELKLNSVDLACLQALPLAYEPNELQQYGELFLCGN